MVVASAAIIVVDTSATEEFVAEKKTFFKS